MPSALSGLLHDAASVYRFVEFIEQYCSEQQVAQSYVPASSLFFEKVESLAVGTKAYLKSVAEQAVAREARPHDKSLDSSWYQNRRDGLLTIKDAWKELQSYIKPAADAHTLRVPAALVELAISQLRALPNMDGANIAVLQTPELNYFQTSHTNLNVAAETLKEKIRAVQPAPISQSVVEQDQTSHIGFVELPYSQGPSFFTNLLLYHELGHYVFEELYPQAEDKANPLANGSEVELRRVYGRRFTSMPKYKRAGAINLVSGWAEEIFCDLFAIRLIGPALSFSAIEMFSLVGLLGQANSIRFTPSHPAPACRFRQHLSMLVDDGWWKEVKSVDSEHRALIESLAKRPVEDYRFYIDEVTPARDQRAIEAFVGVLPVVRNLVDNIIEPQTVELKAYRSQRQEIARCFMHGVVPSRLIKNRRLYAGRPVAVINSAFCFYLSSLSILISKLDKQDPNNIEHRSGWTKKLESWTMKAIEDFQLTDAS